MPDNIEEMRQDSGAGWPTISENDTEGIKYY